MCFNHIRRGEMCLREATVDVRQHSRCDQPACARPRRPCPILLRRACCEERILILQRAGQTCEVEIGKGANDNMRVDLAELVVKSSADRAKPASAALPLFNAENANACGWTDRR